MLIILSFSSFPSSFLNNYSLVRVSTSLVIHASICCTLVSSILTPTLLGQPNPCAYHNYHLCWWPTPGLFYRIGQGMRLSVASILHSPITFPAVCSSLGEVEKKAGLGLILVSALPNIKKDKVGGELECWWAWRLKHKIQSYVQTILCNAEIQYSM